MERIYKFSRERIEEARKRRLNRESRGSDEEYYKNLLEEFASMQEITFNSLRRHYLRHIKNR